MPKILFLASNPKHMTSLRLGEEARDIRDGLKRSKHRDQFDVVEQWAVSPRDFQQVMLDENPEIVHFSGHGMGETGICLEGPTGDMQLVTGEALAALFELFSDRLQCVVLNGCYSEVQAQEIAAHIPYVIGMKQAVGDKGAIEFSVGFYNALGAGQPITKAFKFGQVAMNMAGTGEQQKPVLLSKTDGADNSIPVSTVPPSGLSSESWSEAGGSLSSQEEGAIALFFSYSQEDEALRNKLATHLKLLERTGVIHSWHDRQILPGQESDKQIDQQLKRADIILLLVSSDFLASDYCWDVEVQEAMRRHRAGEACVIPIILREVDWTSAPFGTLKPLPYNEQSVTSWANMDEAFKDIAQGIRQVAESWTSRGPSAPSSKARMATHTLSNSVAPPSPTDSSKAMPLVSGDVLQKRLKLERLLSGLPGPQLSSVITVLRPPAGIIPGMAAPQAERVSALMQWAESETGCGFEQLEEIIQAIVNPR